MAVQLPYPTDDTQQIISAVSTAVDQLFRQGDAYLKAGVGIIEMRDKNSHQFDLFQAGQSRRADEVMKVMDQINQQHGRGSLFLAAQGNSPSNRWYMRQQYLSPQYTTQWADIPVAKC
jgi:DNA polymerase V